MDEYIKRKTAIGYVKNRTPSFDGWTTLNAVEVSLRNAPSADAVAVVRCKDCAYANESGTICMCGDGRATKPMGYCQNGERKDVEYNERQSKTEPET